MSIPSMESLLSLGSYLGFVLAAVLAGSSVIVTLRKTTSLLLAEHKLRAAILAGKILSRPSLNAKSDRLEGDIDKIRTNLEAEIARLSEAKIISETEKKAILDPLEQSSKQGRERYINRLLHPIATTVTDSAPPKN